MAARKPPRSPDQRLLRWQRSMSPGTLNGKVASATPLSVDLTKLAPRLREQTPPHPRIYPYTKSGAISAASTGTIRLYNDTGYDKIVTAIRPSLATVATTTTVIVDVKMNGTTLYTTTANRPALTVGTATALATLPDIVTWTAGSYLTVDVVQGDVAAQNLTVQITAI